MAQTSEKKHWDRFWARSQARGELYATDFRIVRNLEGLVEFDRVCVLEVGAGTGRDSDLMAERGGRVYALDYSEEALRLMQRSNAAGATIVCGDAKALPFPDESFDVVFHQGLLEHFRDPETLLAENARVLKRGGILLVDVPQRYHYYTVLKHIMMACRIWFAGWETEFTVGGLRRLVEESGLRVEDVYGENLSPPVWYRGLRKVLLKFKIGLPMYPLQGRRARAVRAGIKRAIPKRLYVNTAMVIGAIARKP
jgi:SAM-dependent methyltransferase